MADENTILGADSIYFQDVEGEEGKQMELEDSLKLKFSGIIQERYQSAKLAREYDEQRWINAYHNYRGMYGKNVKFRESEKSRVFVKVTKTKVLAAFGQLVDVIFGSERFPIGIRESKIPEGVAEVAHLDATAPLPGIETSSPQATAQEYNVGYAGDGKDNKTASEIKKGQFDDFDAALPLVDGVTKDPKVYEVRPAEMAARRMEKLIHDQIEESHGSSEIRNALFESALFGTGIVKGPFNYNKTLNKWEEAEDGTREYTPVEVRVPRI